MGENHLTSCAKNHSCTNAYSNVIVSFRNPESKAAGPRLATPAATCFTTREARRRRGNQPSHKEGRAGEQTAQCAPSLPNPSANKSRCEFTKWRTKLCRGCASSGLAAKVPTPKDARPHALP